MKSKSVNTQIFQHSSLAAVFLIEKTLQLAVVAGCGIVLGSSAQAAQLTWGGGTSTAWATGANWGGTAPVDDLTTDTVLFNSATYTNQPNAGTRSITGISIGSGNTGTTLNISGTSLSLGASGITVASGSGVSTISATTVKLGANQNWANNSASLLTVSGGITNVGNITPFTLTLNGTGAGGTTLSGIISDGGAVGKTAVVVNTTAGATTISGAGTNTYTGGLTLTKGTLILNKASALGGGTFAIGNNSATATIDNTSGAAINLGNNIQTWNGNFTFTGTNNLVFGNGAVTMTANTNITANGAFSTLTEGGAIGGAFSLTKSGVGTLALNGTNSYSGGTSVTGGTLTLAGTNTNQGAVSISGGTLNINNANALGTATITLTGGGINNTTASAIALANNNAQVWNGNFAFGGTRALDLGTGNVALGVSGATNIVVTASGNSTTALTVGGVISGAGKSLTKAGNGTLILSGSNTYDGGTLVNGGVLQFASAAAIAGSGNNVAVNNFGTAAFGYALDQATLTSRIVAGSKGTVALGANVVTDLDFGASGLGNLSLGAAGGTFTYSGNLWTPANSVFRLGGGGGNLVFDPALTGSNSLLVGGGGSGGTVTLTNAGTYSGGTTVTGGTGSPAVGAVNGASLLQTNVLSGTSTTPFGTGPITLNNGALGLGTVAALTSGQSVSASGYDLTFNGLNSINLAVGGGSSVTFAANTLTRSNRGVLLLNPTSGSTLGTTEKVTVASGAPIVTNGMVSPYYINGTTKNFLTYDATDGFKDVVPDKTGTNALPTGILSTDNVLVNESGNNTTFSGVGNLVLNSLRIVNTNASNGTQTIGTSADSLTIVSGGLLLNWTAGQANTFTGATINFGAAEAVVGVFGVSGSTTISSLVIGTGGFTTYGTQSLTIGNLQTTGGITIAGGSTMLVSGNGTLSINPNNTLTIGKGGVFGSNANNRPAQFLGLAGEGVVNWSSATGGSNTGSNTYTIDGLTGTGTTTFGGTIVDGGGSYTLNIVKNGLNTQVFSGANSYVGTTTVNGGVLRLDFSAAGAPSNNILNNVSNSSALVLGGGKLDIVGAAGATNSQQLNGLTINSGNSAIALTAGSGGGVPTVTLGSTFTRNVGGTVEFAYASGTPISTAATTNITNGVWTQSAALPTAFATINGTDWATISSGNIVAASGGTLVNDDYSASTNNTTVAVGGSAATSDFTINTLRFNAAGKNLDLSGTTGNTIGTGGILVTGAATGSVINGGTGITLKSGTGRELVIIDNGALTVNAVMADSAAGASTLTLSGSGTTTLNAANTFTGSAYINSGTVVAGNAAAFGTTAGTLNLNGGSLQSSSALTLNAKAISLNNNFTIGGSNNLTLSGTITNNRNYNTLTINNSGTTTFSGNLVLGAGQTLTVAGSGNVTASGVLSTTGGLNYAGSGTMTLSNAASTYTGVTKVSGGTLSVSTLAAGAANSSIGAATNSASNLVLDGGTLKYTGAAVSTDRLFSVGGSGGTLDASGSGAVNFTNSGAIGFANTPGTRTLNLTGTNTGANTVNAVIGDHLGIYATSLTKSGTGTWVLSGSNTYTGATTVSTGTLLVNGSLGNTAVTVGSAGILGGSGSFAGSVNIQGTHNPGNSPGIQTFNSNLSYSGGASVVNFELKSNTTTNAANPNAVFDSMVVNGNLDFAALTTLNLSFVPAGTDVLWADTFWDTSKTGTSGWLLYDVAGTTTGFANLSLASINWLDSGSNAFNTQRPGAGFSLFQSGSDIYLNYTTAVPEPSTYLLVGLGLGALCLLRRRKTGVS